MTEQEAINRIFDAIEATDRHFACAGGAGNYAAAKAAWDEIKAIAAEDLAETTAAVALQQGDPYLREDGTYNWRAAGLPSAIADQFGL